MGNCCPKGGSSSVAHSQDVGSGLQASSDRSVLVSPTTAIPAAIVVPHAPTPPTPTPPTPDKQQPTVPAPMVPFIPEWMEPIVPDATKPMAEPDNPEPMIGVSGPEPTMVVLGAPCPECFIIPELDSEPTAAPPGT